MFGHSNNNSLVFKTIKSAIQSLQSGEQPLIHSDRGFQYTSKGFKRIVETANMTQSMSVLVDVLITDQLNHFGAH